VVDEGTFDIFGPPGGPWWVGFHGQDGTYAYRGLARTATFAPGGWAVDGADGTPRDASITRDDAAGWREQWAPGGPVGAGAGSMLDEDGVYYALVEVPDRSLACTPGQNWDFGLLRTRDLGSARWEQFPAGNPIAYSSRPEGGCNPIYPRLLRDPASGTTYVTYGRPSADPARDGIYVYRVAWDRNLLRNGSFWRADADGWQARAGASLEVQRNPDASPDGTPSLALGCGSAGCAGAPSAFQDVATDGTRGGETLAFGARVRADAGTGRIRIVLHQIDGQGTLLHSTAVDADLTTRYAAPRGTAEVDARTRLLRVELYPLTSGPLRADDAYLIPQGGCDAPRFPTC
jgi:hypothetical protein